MALEPLLPLDSIDVSARLMTREDIAAYLPHRGPIAMLDALVHESDDLNEGAAIANIPLDPWWADGHIPGHPLMPGVLQIEAAAQLASLFYYRRSGVTLFAGFTRINEVTFRGMVAPGDTLLLLAVGVKYSPKRFVSRIQGLVNNEIVLDGEIAGMIFPNLGEVTREPLTQPARS